MVKGKGDILKNKAFQRESIVGCLPSAICLFRVPLLRFLKMVYPYLLACSVNMGSRMRSWARVVAHLNDGNVPCKSKGPQYLFFLHLSGFLALFLMS